MTSNRALNAICPYFTMFPLEFPLRVLEPRGSRGDWVLDPFAGRGTTNYAARLLGLPSVGIDSSPVAVALTEAKLANASSDSIVETAQDLLRGGQQPKQVPKGEFWSLAFHKRVLVALCTLRELLLKDCQSDDRRALRGVLLGALHGPITKTSPSHLSNQCTRTYAPKPRYAVNFWRARQLSAPYVDVLEVIRVRANRYYTGQSEAHGVVIAGDSRNPRTFSTVNAPVRWIVTSPPFYGMRTYVPDQWLRNWFVGGPANVDYSTTDQLGHGSPLDFAHQLRTVWNNLAAVTADDAQLIVRFGGIHDRKNEPLGILKESFRGSAWKLSTIVPAGSADSGKRQATHMSSGDRSARLEHDAWAVLR